MKRLHHILVISNRKPSHNTKAASFTYIPLIVSLSSLSLSALIAGVSALQRSRESPSLPAIRKRRASEARRGEARQRAVNAAILALVSLKKHLSLSPSSRSYRWHQSAGHERSHGELKAHRSTVVQLMLLK